MRRRPIKTTKKQVLNNRSASLSRTAVSKFKPVTLVLVLLSILPGLAISYYIYWRDRHDPEPHELLLLCFLFGVMSTYPAIKMEEFGIQDLRLGVSKDVWITMTFAFVVIAFSEELVKYIFLRYALYPRKAFNEPMDGIVYSVMISMGFATMENVLYVVVNPTDSSHAMQVGLMRMFTAVPAHAAFAITMGYFVGLAKLHPERENLYLICGILGAILLHGLYDFFIFQKLSRVLVVFTFITLFLSLAVGFYFIYRHSGYNRRKKPAASKAEAESIDPSGD